MKGIISNIQRFSIHDGPGIRTTVFLKGCNLRCFWCHNPECINNRVEPQYFQNKCINCMNCTTICQQGVHSTQGGKKVLQREKCIACGSCVKKCPAEALQLEGTYIQSEDLFNIIKKDRVFYDTSGGGVTFSGGEPLLQKEFLKETLILCKNESYHITIESAANLPWEYIQHIYEMVDLFIIDIKTMSNNLHKDCTGVENTLILENIKKLSSLKSELWVRTPVIPGINADVESIECIANFVNTLNNNVKHELIPFHKLAINKYDSLDRKYKGRDLETPTIEKMKLLIQVLERINKDKK